MFDFTFAGEKADLEEKAVSIELDMSEKQIIAIKANPKSKVNLGSKVIYTYEDMKITFIDGLLKDVQ